MRLRRWTQLLASAVLTLAVGALGAERPAAWQEEAAKLSNPVPSSASSIAAGKKLFDGQCTTCHGPMGKGDGKGGQMLKPPPSDLTDATWKHGSSDGEIFVAIRDGAQKTGMRPYGSRIATNDIWNLVNYVRTLGPSVTGSH
jgi:putative copper resistance protein D